MQTQNSYTMEDLVPVICEFFKEGKQVIVTATGNSMEPLIRNARDSIILAAYNGEKLSVGDAVFYKRSDSRYVLHRIVDIANDGSYTMLGDNQTLKETGIKTSQVIACPIAVIRGNKTIATDSKSYLRYARFWTKSVFFRKLHIKLFYLKARLLRRLKRLFKK